MLKRNKVKHVMKKKIILRGNHGELIYWGLGGGLPGKGELGPFPD